MTREVHLDHKKSKQSCHVYSIVNHELARVSHHAGSYVIHYYENDGR